jgi:hypothetical protein
MSTKKGNRLLTYEELKLSIERDLAEAKKIEALWDSSQDLLEALIKAEKVLVELSIKGWGNGLCIEDAIFSARAAIAKAEGVI